MKGNPFLAYRQQEARINAVPDIERVVVGISGLSAARGDVTLITYSLGSCVGICMYDKPAKIGALAHCLLPSSADAAKNAQRVITGSELGKYIDVAIDKMLQLMLEMGADRKRITAELFGGAEMFNFGRYELPNIGKMNVAAAHKKLCASAIPITRSEVGGDSARTILFNVGNGDVQVRVTPKTLKS